MSTEKDLFARVSQANPVSGIDDLDATELEAALTVIERRWHSVVDGPPATKDSHRRRLRPLLVSIAAAVVVALLIGIPILLAGGRDGASVTDSGPAEDTAAFSARIVPDAPVLFAVSVALAPDGTPVSLYIAEPQDRAVLIACTDPACNSFTETVVAEFVTFGQVSKVEIGNDGLPVFAFIDHDVATRSTEGGIVHCSDAACAERSVQLLDFDHEGLEPTLTIDPEGLPAAVFTESGADGQAKTYRLVRCHDSTCQDHSVGSIPNAGWNPVIEFPDSDRPVLAFVRTAVTTAVPTADLVMVACTDPTCAGGGPETVVAEVGLNAPSLDMVIPPDGLPVFAFDTPKLHVARCLEPSCSGDVDVSVVALDLELVRVLEIGPGGLPVIAYTSAPDNVRELRVATCTDPACSAGTIEVLDSDDWMITIDMILNPAGQPVIGYQAGTEMRIASCGDSGCAAESQRSLQWDQAQFEIPESTIAEASGWTRTMESLAGGGGPSHIRATTTWAQGLISVGAHNGIPTAWTSPDGTTWSEFMIASEGDVADVIAGGPGLIAVGTTCSPPEMSPCDPAIWTSSDGAKTWTPVTDSDAFGGCSSLVDPSDFGCQTWIDQVLPTATGFLATGVDIVDGAEPNREVAWTSPDGLAWQRLAAPPTVDRPPYPELVAEADWQGGRYGLGTRCSGNDSSLTCQPLGWFSPDGTSWDPIALNPADFAASEHAALMEGGIHLVSGEFGLLAIGMNIDPTTSSPTPMMFVSEDGEHWTAFRLSPEMWGINALTSFGDRVFAAGVGGVWMWTPPT